MITPTGNVTTLAGTAGVIGSADANGTNISNFLILSKGENIVVSQADAIAHFNNQLSQLGGSYNSLPPLFSDLDLDGISDATDNCPTRPNPLQEIVICPPAFCSSQLQDCPGGSQVAQDPWNHCAYCPCPTPGVPTLPCPDLGGGGDQL